MGVGLGDGGKTVVVRFAQDMKKGPLEVSCRSSVLQVLQTAPGCSGILDGSFPPVQLHPCSLGEKVMEPCNVLIVSATLILGREAWEGSGMFPCPDDEPGWAGVQSAVILEIEAMVKTLTRPGESYRLTVQGDRVKMKGPEAKAFAARWDALQKEGGVLFGWVPVLLDRDLLRKAGNNGQG